jgi:hypothetical protein
MIHETTYHGLDKWYRHLFEKLGWVMLAKEEGHTYRISPYKKSISHLKKSLQEKISITQDVDRKQDLEIILHKISILEKHVNKDFKLDTASKK